MLLWIAFAVMTVVATLAVLLPLARGRSARAAAASDHEIAVYKDQLAELDRDRERGLIGAGEADAARTEIARRLLKAGAGAGAGDARRTWAGPVALAVAVLVPAGALALYTAIGSPELPDQPLSARLQADPTAADDVGLMIAKVERHLEQNPDDLQGWKVLAPIYVRQNRPADAARAWRRILALEGPTPQVQEDFGEALVAVNEGLVTPEAQAAFDGAVTAEPSRVKSRYYRALGLSQAGRHREALADWDEILRTSPADAPWLEAVRGQRAKTLADAGLPADTPAPSPLPAAEPQVAANGPGPTAEDVAAASGMAEADRGAMIAGMVERLAERLKAEPRDAEGWQRLIRAYVVLGRTEDAKAAYDTARNTFQDDAGALDAIDAVARENGVTAN